MRWMLVTLALAACAPQGSYEDHPLDEVLPDDEQKADDPGDSLTRPTAHGHLFQDVRQVGAIVPGHQVRNLSWRFALGRDARATLVLAPAPGRATQELVLYVYRREADGLWHRQEQVPAPGSQAEVPISGAGDYRVIVKGASEQTQAMLQLTLACQGPGCPGQECLFTGWTPGVTHGSIYPQEERLVSGDHPPPFAINEAQILAATGAASLAEAGEVTLTTLIDELAGERYVRVAQGGEEVFFQAAQSVPVARRHGDVLTACSVMAHACSAGQTTGDTPYLLGPPVEETLVTVSDPVLAAQVVAAVQVVAPQVTTASQALAAAGPAGCRSSATRVA